MVYYLIVLFIQGIQSMHRSIDYSSLIPKLSCSSLIPRLSCSSLIPRLSCNGLIPSLFSLLFSAGSVRKVLYRTDCIPPLLALLQPEGSTHALSLLFKESAQNLSSPHAESTRHNIQGMYTTVSSCRVAFVTVTIIQGIYTIFNSGPHAE